MFNNQIKKELYTIYKELPDIEKIKNSMVTLEKLQDDEQLKESINNLINAKKELEKIIIQNVKKINKGDD